MKMVIHIFVRLVSYLLVSLISALGGIMLVMLGCAWDKDIFDSYVTTVNEISKQ